MNSNLYCIIMAGGVGSRFWPMSREARPKQFLDILGLGKTFLQMTFERMAQIVPRENILIVTSERYGALVREQLPEIPQENVLMEPYKRNTAPCVAYATYKLYKRNPDAIVVVSPADHFITGENLFADTVSRAMEEAATSGKLYTIGIKPTRPETNYGYIQMAGESKSVGPYEVRNVKTFTEKPDLELAKVFLETGEFVWNSGIFIWSLKSIIREMESLLPEVADIFSKGADSYYTSCEKDFIQQAYASSPSISIDYGVMEKTKNCCVFPSTFGWSDVGTWNSVYERSSEKDENGNIVKCKVSMVQDTKGSIVQTSDPEKLVVVKGLENMMVIDLDDVLMVCPRCDKAIKDVITDLTMRDITKEYL